MNKSTLLNKKRLPAGLSHRNLAQITGISATKISHIMVDLVQPTPEELALLERALDPHPDPRGEIVRASKEESRARQYPPQLATSTTGMQLPTSHIRSREDE